METEQMAQVSGAGGVSRKKPTVSDLPRGLFRDPDGHPIPAIPAPRNPYPAEPAFVPSEERLFELWMKRMPMNGIERIESVIGFEQALNKIRAAAWNAGWVARMDDTGTTNPYGDA